MSESEYKVRVYRSGSSPDVYFLNTALVVDQYLFVEIQFESLTLNGKRAIRCDLDLGILGNISTETGTISYKVTTPGIVTPSLLVTYVDGSSNTFSLKQKIYVYNTWPVYDHSTFRVLGDIVPSLPYSLEDVSIKPNEFGVSDIINTSLSRLNDCAMFVKAQTKALISVTPTEYSGWLGYHKRAASKGVAWHTPNNFPDLSSNSSEADISPELPEFANIIDVKLAGNEMFILSKDVDGNLNIMVDSIKSKLTPVIFDTKKTALGIIKSASSLAVEYIDPEYRALYIADNIGNKIYKLILNVSDSTNLKLTIEQSVGGYGLRNEPTRFFSPLDITLSNSRVYVADYNNNCIKVLNKNLGWTQTIYIDDFASHPVVSISVTKEIIFDTENQSSTYLTMALTETRRVYVFNKYGDIFNTNTPYYDLVDIPAEHTPVKIQLDYINNFFYVLCKEAVYKYSFLGVFIGKFSNIVADNFMSLATDMYRNLYVVCSNKVHKLLDIIESVDIAHSSYDDKMYSIEDIKVNNTEMYQDWVINRALNRLAINIDLIYRSIHSRFSVSRVNTPYGVKNSFSIIPVSRADIPACNLIPNIGVGANEMSLAQIYNRDITKIYNCISSLLLFTNLTFNNNVQQAECKDIFCWSWKSTKCMNIDSAFVKICDINPLTFKEVESSSKGGYNATSTWEDAKSTCCI